MYQIFYRVGLNPRILEISYLTGPVNCANGPRSHSVITKINIKQNKDEISDFFCFTP